MNHSSKSFARIDIFYALVLVLALGAAVVFFANNKPVPIPVTNVDTSAAPNAAARSMDLGAGYRLEMDADSGRIVAPEAVIRPADKTYDLGAGYRLVITANGGEIVAPAARPSGDVKRMDLGAGYVLETTSDSGRIIAPSSSVRSEPQPAAQHKEYVGGGYWLITGPDGGGVVPEGTK